MNALYDSDHDTFRASVREFLNRHVTDRIDDFRSERAISRSVWTAAGEQGYLGLCVPEAYGGSDAGDYRFNAVLLEELAKVTMGLVSSLSIHFDVVAPYLVRLTSEEQRRRWLPQFGSGDIVTAIAMSEPSVGSDLAALRTSAVRVDGGWTLSGAKTFITNGFGADLVVVAARTTPGSRSAGISLFAVERAMEGFTRGRKLDKVGQGEADTAELFFDDVFVPEANLIGSVDQGFAHMMEGLSQERLGAAVANLAHARQILLETVAYATQRHAFGTAIGSFQHNKFLLAELETQVCVTQAYVDQCVARHAAAELTSVDAAKAKWWTSQVQSDVLDHCVQLHGGYGYMNEYRVAQAWRDARVTKIWAGSNEIMKELIGRDLGL